MQSKSVPIYGPTAFLDRNYGDKKLEEKIYFGMIIDDYDPN